MAVIHKCYTVSVILLIFSTTIFSISYAEATQNIASSMELHEIVPDVIETAPSKPAQITYENDVSVEQGNELTPSQVKNQPKVTWPAETGSYYTLCMTDPDAPSRKEPRFREFHHWLVGNIPETKVAEGQILSEYVGSGPPQGTGLHRYVFLIYKQPDGRIQFNETYITNRSREGRPKFSIKAFAEKYGLGQPIAGNFYQAKFDSYVPILHQQLSG